MSYNPPSPEWQNQGTPQDGGQQPQPSALPFGQQPGYGARLYPEQSQAGLALGLGISALISLCLCAVLMPFLGGAAWFFGSAEKKAISQGRRDPSGQGQANAGMIMGIVSVAMCVFAVLAYVLIVGLAIFSAGPPS